MRFHSYTPGAPLHEFVEDFWMYEGYAGGHAHERILPSGTFELVFNLQDDELRIYGPSKLELCRHFTGALISGPYAGPFISDTAEEASIMGAHFRPGGAFALLGPAVGEMLNTHIDLQSIWGAAAVELREQLCAASTPAARFRLLERAILVRLCDRRICHGAVREALTLLTRAHGRARVRDISKAVDLSQRRFIEVFTTEVGLTPKLFSRVQRFQRALALSRNAIERNWAQLAADCGYYDQSHLIRDFAEFSGICPANYQQLQSRLDRDGIHVKRNHLPLVE
jgi:AraC-like DNA-binding protein